VEVRGGTIPPTSATWFQKYPYLPSLFEGYPGQVVISIGWSVQIAYSYIITFPCEPEGTPPELHSSRGCHLRMILHQPLLTIDGYALKSFCCVHLRVSSHLQWGPREVPSPWMTIEGTFD
jgi:hypothetical protein